MKWVCGSTNPGRMTLVFNVSPITCGWCANHGCMDVRLPVESTLPSMTAMTSATGRPGSMVMTLRAGGTVIVP